MQDGLSFWPTPRAVAEDLLGLVLCPGYGRGEASGGVPQVRVLEPSAGVGDLVEAVRGHLPYAHVTGVEPDARRAGRLRCRGLADELFEGTLEDYLASRVEGDAPFDMVLMNPPFTLPGRREAWAEHVLAVCGAPGLLAQGAIVGAVVPRIVLTGGSRLTREVRALLGAVHHCGPDDGFVGDRGGVRPCDRGAFAAAVSTALLWVQPAEPAPVQLALRA